MSIPHPSQRLALALLPIAVLGCGGSSAPALGTSSGAPGGVSSGAAGSSGNAGSGGGRSSGSGAGGSSGTSGSGQPASGGSGSNGSLSNLDGGAPGDGGGQADTGGVGDGASATGCTRDQLTAIVNTYFKALTAHDPKQLPASPALQFTENGKTLQLGQGVWQTATALQFHRNLLDTERCGTLTEAVITNQGAATIFGVRLKLENHSVTEVETVVVDPSTGFFPTPQGIINSAADDWEGLLPADQRSTRAQLNAAADAYFNLFSNSSTPVPFNKPCDRLENGFQTTRGDCSSGIPAGNLPMTHRRYPVADLEAGIGVGFVLFAGSLVDFHMFKLIGGKIRFINAVVGPSATTSGWPDQPAGN